MSKNLKAESKKQTKEISTPIKAKDEQKTTTNMPECWTRKSGTSKNKPVTKNDNCCEKDLHGTNNITKDVKENCGLSKADLTQVDNWKNEAPQRTISQDDAKKDEKIVK
jgi:hypothetical protein